MSKLFSPLSLGDITFKNRIFVSPMCQYSADDGVPNDWHFVHLGSRAVGGAALVMTEATAVAAKGRISPKDTGLWNEKQKEAFRPIVDFIHKQGSVAGIQLAHAGRKASTKVPWEGSGKIDNGWTPDAPSSVAFSEDYPMPKELTYEGMKEIEENYISSTNLANEAGFKVIELHMAHGYLMHEFLSPFSNQRKDEYGGSLDNRMRFPLQVAKRVRALWKHPLFVRISATDWAPSGGWDLEQSVIFAKELKTIGIDLIDCSSGGTLTKATIPMAPGYQVPFSATIRKEAGIATGAVGLIDNPKQAESIIEKGEADAIFMAREFLRDPYFPLRAAKELGVKVEWPVQYQRAIN